MFNNHSAAVNGERWFYNKIKKDINVIFDVGSRYDSEFSNFGGEVHYFEPVEEFIKKLSVLPNSNKVSKFNNFGLGSKNEEKYYYDSIQSFNARTKSLPGVIQEKKNKLQIKTGYDYMKEQNIESIDFLKIDTEGYEFEVIKGFKEKLNCIKIIQFEYGGCYLDNNVKLNDVIKYLESKNFHNFSYLDSNSLKKIKDLRGKTITTCPEHRNGQWSSIQYPVTVEHMNEDGVISDHYNYCNIVCINKNSNLDYIF